ncbi:MAG: stage II sporulation protein R [Oscillospiraceae bacterium]|jgi:stage II sporulation protein R|nr:stage II sporulation protein R [Oscillospiraceae bacterium]
MKAKIRAKIFETATLIALSATMLITSAFSEKQAALAEKIIRLHVVAASDSDADQSLKLRVRDAVLAVLAEPLSQAVTRGEALAAAERLLPEIEAAAREEIARSGFGYSVAATLESERFPTRVYDDFTLPAGVYESLRITIGSGAGTNWWCVVFPALCREAATEEQTEAAFSALSGGEIKLITDGSGGVKIKFRLFEGISKLKKLLGK